MAFANTATSLCCCKDARCGTSEAAAVAAGSIAAVGLTSLASLLMTAYFSVHTAGDRRNHKRKSNKLLR